MFGYSALSVILLNSYVQQNVTFEIALAAAIHYEEGINLQSLRKRLYNNISNIAKVSVKAN